MARPAWSQSRTLPDAPGTWKAWKPFSAISSVRTERSATPAEVKAFEATLLELNAILRRAPGVASPRGYSVETWGYLSGLGLPVPGKPAGKSLPLGGGLQFGAFPIFEYERNGKMIREDTGETALMAFMVNDPWTGSSRKPEEWGGVETDAFIQPRRNGELAGIPRYGDMLVIAKAPESLWVPVPFSAAIDLVAANRRDEVAGFQETLEKFKARLAVVRDPARQAQRLKEAREAAVGMAKPEEFVASIAESIRIEEASLVEELGPKGSSSKGLAAAQKVIDDIAAWLAELSPADRAAPACFATEAKSLRARFRPGLIAGCAAIVKPNYQYFNAALPRSAPQVLVITPVERCFDTANKYNREANSSSPAGCAANRKLIETMVKDAIRAWLR
jgi:hypothetical protein